MYIELHCHSAFSFLDGASLPEHLVLEAQTLGYPALALTDHNGLYGSMAFAQAAKQMGLQAITGAEVTLLDGSHVTLLAQTTHGYANRFPPAPPGTARTRSAGPTASSPCAPRQSSHPSFATGPTRSRTRWA